MRKESELRTSTTQIGKDIRKMKENRNKGQKNANTSTLDAYLDIANYKMRQNSITPYRIAIDLQLDRRHIRRVLNGEIENPSFKLIVMILQYLGIRKINI